MWRKFQQEIHQSWFVVWFAIGVIGGTILGLVFRINFLAAGWFLMLGGILFMICMVRPLLVCSVLALAAGFCCSFVRVSRELTNEKYVRQFYGMEVMVTGEISGDPETDERQTKIKLSNLRFGENREAEAMRGSLYVVLQKNEELKWGDTVTLRGKMGEGFGTYVGNMYKPRVMWWARPEPRLWILTARDWFAERVEQAVGGTEAKLGLSYLMGMKTGLTDELEEDLRTVGLTHIVVASGAHLAILVEVARKLFGRISRFAGLMFSVVFVVVFMALVGWTPSILRAGAMAILTLITWYGGRKIESWRMILLVATVTLLINPMFLINLGWLLSFASYIGIMMVMPRLVKFFYGGRKPGTVGSTVLMTVSATVMTLPIVLYFYGQVSLIAVAANLLILPTLSFAMGMTFMAGVVAFVPAVNVMVGWVARNILAFHIAVVEKFGEWTQFLVKIEPYQTEVFLVYLAVGGGLVWAIWTEKKKSGKIRVSN